MRDRDYRNGPNQGLDELRESVGLTSRSIRSGKVVCLRCDKSFQSEDKVRIRICVRCKRDSIWSGSQAADALHPAIPNMGYNNPREVASKGRARKGSLIPKKKSRLGTKSAAKKRSLSRNQKHFGKRPLARKRTRS